LSARLMPFSLSCTFQTVVLSRLRIGVPGR
jgi:hypothetical protein